MRFAITILAIAAWLPVLASPARAEDPPTSFLDREMAYTHKAGSADVTVEAFVKSLGPGTWEADPGDGGYIYRASRFDQLTAATHTSAWLLIVDATGSVQVPRAVMDGIEQPLLGFSAVAQAASLPSRPSLPAEMSGTVQPVPAAPPDDSRSVLNTLERLRSLRQQTDTSTSPTRPRGPELGVSLRGSDNASLSAVQRGAVGEKVRDCWTRDAGVLHADTFQVHLIVTTDATGVARQAEIAPGDPASAFSSPLHALAERAVLAVLAAPCPTLPLPQSMIGQPHRFDFIFKP